MLFGIKTAKATCMRYIQSLLACAFLTATFSVVMAQEPDRDKKPAEGTAQMTGCLSKSTDGSYVLKNETDGKQVTVTGSADLEKHSANHKVKLHGTEKMEGGKSVFQVQKIEHLASSCPASPK